MFSFFGLGSNSKTSSSLTTKGRKMARTQQYVIYTREFRTRAKQIGVFAEPVSGYTVNGAVHGGKIKFKNLAVKNTKRKTPAARQATGVNTNVRGCGVRYVHIRGQALHAVRRATCLPRGTRHS